MSLRYMPPSGYQRGLKNVKQVVIVGGGITGLAAAYRLQTGIEINMGAMSARTSIAASLGHGTSSAPSDSEVAFSPTIPEIQITLVEQDTRLGGKIVTERVDGFIIEGAPDCFLSRKPHGFALCEELGVTGRLQGRNPAQTNTYVMRNGQLHDLPQGLTGLVPTNLDALANSTLISAAGRARLAQETELPAAPDEGDESVAHFISRRLGKEVFEQLIEPLMGGIYSGDAAQLSLAATFPQLRQLELKYGSLIKGLLAKQNGHASSSVKLAPAYPPFVAFRTGMAELIEILVERLTECTIITGSAVESIRRTTEAVSTGYTLTLANGDSLHADVLILTTPAFITARLVAPWDKELAAAHNAIPYASTATVTLAYHESKLPAPLDGRGYVIPSVEASEVKACTWTSSKWVGRAPDGFALIRVYLGRYGKRDILQDSDEELLQLAQAELKRTLNITAPPDFTRIYRWPNAMPQYNLGHLERLAQIETRLAHHPGFLLAGATYHGVGIPDCIRSAEEAAKATFDYLIECR